MRDNYTHISIVLDRSGSMTSVCDATIEGLNGLINQQKELQKNNPHFTATVSLVQFDDYYELNYDFLNLPLVADLNRDTYQPRGSTALLDAIGRAIKETGARLAALPENERPSKVLFVIQTDGEENASRKFSKNEIFDMINHQKSNYQWDFMFLGANQDAIATAASLGVNSKSTMSYAHSSMGTMAVFRAAANYTSGTLCAANALATDKLAFSDEDRKDAVESTKSTV